MAIDGARSIANGAARSLSRIRFTSSTAILSDRGGSSSRICRACGHVSQPSVCVKNSRRTVRVIFANSARSLSWSDGESSGTIRLCHWRANRARPPDRASSTPYLNRSSNAFLAPLEVDGELPASVDVDDAGELVCRSIVVRGAKSVHALRSSFGATRAGILSLCAHSHRALVSNETH